MSESTSFVSSWIHLVRRRWRTGLVVYGAVILAALAVLLLARPVYRSEAALRLGEPPPQGGVSPGAGVFSFFQLGGDPFANDLELLASRTLAESVAEQTTLNVRLDAPADWHRDSLFASLRADRDAPEASYEVRHDRGAVRVRRTSPEDSVIGVVAPGQAVSFGGVSATFLPHRPGMPEKFAIAVTPFGEATRRIRSGVSVERPRREANVVSISYDHTDPGVADGVVTAVVRAFMELRTALQHRESGETVDSIRAVARATAAELRRAEESLQALQEEALLVAPEAQSEAIVDRHAELLSRLTRATAELSGVEEMLRRLDAVRDSARGWTALLSYPAFLESQTLGELLTELTTLHAERAEVATRRSDDSREIQALDRQIDYLDRSVRSVAAEYRAGLIAQVESLRPLVTQMERLLGSLPEQTSELGRRMRDVRILTEVTVVTEQRLRQEELREALTYAKVQVIDPPALLHRPVWPRLKLGFAVALLLAAAFALLGMVARDRADRPPQPVRQVEAPREEARAVWG